MTIADQVANLPDVGESVITQARAFDFRQQDLDQQQARLNEARRAFLVSLRSEWTAEELTDAGLFF